MQITIEDISPVEKRVEFELPWTDVAPKLDKAYGALRRDVRMPGFRPGKVPRALLEKLYKQQVEEEVARELVERSLGQAIQENQIEPVAPPTVDNLELKSGSPFKFSARVEVRSQVAPKDYSGVSLTRRAPRVKDEEVTEALEGYRRRFTEYKPVEGRAQTQPGDVVLAEVRGRIGEHKIKQRTVAIDLDDDAGGALPGLASRLRGLSIGSEPVELKYTLAEDAAVPKELAGKAVDLKVTIKEAREKKVPELDDELAKDTGEAETLDGLRAKVRERLVEADKQAIHRELVQQLVKHLVKVNEFPIAPALVDRYAQALVGRTKAQLRMAGMDVESFDDARMRVEFKKDAEEEARGTILIHAIAEREGVTVTDADMQKRIAELAASRNENPKKLRADLEKENRLQQIEAQIREQKTLDMLIAQAKITDEDPSASSASSTGDRLILTPDEARAEAAKTKR